MSFAPTSPPPLQQHGATPAFSAAELDRRFTACVIDRAVAWGCAAGVGYAVWQLAAPDRFWVAVATFAGVAVLLGAVTAVLVGTTGVTPGKTLVGLRVVRRSDGRPIGVPAALGRTLLLGLGGLPTLGLGVATLAWTAAMDPGRLRRGIHDRIGDAVVVDVRPAPEEAPVEDDRPQQIVNLTAMRLLPSPAAEATTPPASGSPAAAAAPTAGRGAVDTPPPARPAPPAAPTVAPASGPAPAPGPALVPGPALAPGPAPAPGPALAPGPATQLRDAPAVVTTRWRVSFDSGESFVVEGLALVGRRPEARSGEPVRHLVPLRSSDMSLSKTHAQFQVAPDGALVVMDRGSTNGSAIVRKGLSKALSPGRPATLLDGDEVRFGDRAMKVVREA